jgi:hypothetical protein
LPYNGKNRSKKNREKKKKKRNRTSKQDEMARKHVKSPGAQKSHQHIQLRGKLLALEQLLHLIGEAGILIGRRSLLTHEHTHTHTKPSTNNTIKIVSSRPNLSLSLFLLSFSPTGHPQITKKLQQKRRAHEP